MLWNRSISLPVGMDDLGELAEWNGLECLPLSRAVGENTTSPPAANGKSLFQPHSTKLGLSFPHLAHRRKTLSPTEALPQVFRRG